MFPVWQYRTGSVDGEPSASQLELFLARMTNSRLKYSTALAAQWLLLTLSGCAALAPLPTWSDVAMPYQFERFTRPGPVAGVMAKVDLTDPRVEVRVVLADETDPDGAGPCVGQLDTTSNAARGHDFAITLNASFFAAPNPRVMTEKRIPYFVGNCGIPEGWHVSAGKVMTRPTKESLRDVLVVHRDGKVTLHERALELPADTRYAVSGSAIVVQGGQVVARPSAAARHPRSAVGLSADGRTLLMVAVDGRQDHSRGVTLEELGVLMQSLGAHHALNLDGGGSTALVVKDPASGVFAIANQLSDTSIGFPTLKIERPVVDVIGIVVR